MEKLTTEKRAAILRTLVEGSSVASTCRINGVNKETALNLIKAVGEACADYMGAQMVNLPCKVVQLDELWSFVGCKEKAKKTAVGEHPGDVWTWTSLCADTKLIPSWRVGDRSARTAFEFCGDLAGRFAGDIQITTDGAAPYRFPVCSCFPDAHFAQLIKIYGTDAEGKEVCIGARKCAVQGQPDAALISTSYVERSNLTVRIVNRRFTRKTNAFSKKLEALCNMLAITFTAYNFTRKHLTLGTTPAVAAGVASRILRMEEVVEMVDAYAQRKQDEAYEAALTKLTPLRIAPKAYAPVKPKTPWYLDPHSGGKFCPVEDRKPGVDYSD